MAALVVIGASSGGPIALRSLISALPADFPAPILIVVHIGPQPSVLPSILNGASKLPAVHAEDGEVMEPGHIYVAPPDQHLLVMDGKLELDRGPRENYTRPAIDPLFRSAAKWYGPDTIGIILTGELNDGTVGLYEVKKAGGTVIVQDPRDAEWPSMPKSALKNVKADFCLPLSGIPQVLVELATKMKQQKRGKVEGGAVVMSKANPDFDRPVAQTCPECGGALSEQVVGKQTQFSCHIGHVMNVEVLAIAQREAIEKDLNAVLRMLNERIELCRSMGQKSALMGDEQARERWTAAEEEAQSRVGPVRQLAEAEWMHSEAD